MFLVRKKNKVEEKVEGLIVFKENNDNLIGQKKANLPSLVRCV